MNNKGGLQNAKSGFSLGKSLYLCVLLVSLLCTQWIGLWHSVSHTNFQIKELTLSSAPLSDDSNNQHSGSSCQSLDNLALGSFIQNAVKSFHLLNHFKHVLTQLRPVGHFSLVELSYNSRAPPANILL